MQLSLSLLTLIPLLSLTTAFPTTTKTSLIQSCEKADLGKSCNAGFIRGVAATGICTSTVINVEKGVFSCSVAATSTATSPVASSSVSGDATADKAKHLEYLRRIVERGVVVF